MKKYIYAIILLLIGIITYPTICYARTYQISSANTESDYNFWNGWKEFHYGATDVGSKKGDSVTFRTPMIVNGNLTYYESTGTMRGYGYYSFDFSKHILGLLSYIKNKVTDYHTEYAPINDIPEFDEFGNVKEPTAVNMREAVNKTITKLVSNWYSTEYEQGEFADFWTKCITNKVSEYGNELKKLQNKFYFDAYASNAISKLTDLMGNSYCRKLSDKEMTALRGVVFSIMEARYRNKNMQGKTNLKLKVAEGDLWPFLVNLKNLNKITRDSSGHYSPALEFPDFDDVIDGAYQWMYYYDSQINSSTSHSTVTSYMNAQMEEEEETEADWEGEYDALTHEDFPYLNSNAELTAFYTRCSTVRTLFKKSTENAEGIFGAEELYDITSETSYSEAMKKMKDSMDRFANAVGGDIKDVFIGLTDYNIERTYLMAKNIVENEVIQNEYAYYNIGTNIITFTPGLDGSEYLLIDFQKVKLEEPLIKFNGNNRYETNKDTDKDGILDKLELGDGHSSGPDETEMYKKVNITGFIKKMVEDELYGADTASLNTPEGKELVESALANIKYNVYKKRKEFLGDHGDDNVTDRAEEYEHYLNLDSASTNAISTLTNQAQIIERLKGDNAKLQVELYKYTSNPVLKDTDFDGLDDKTESDNGFKAKSGLRTQNNVHSQVGDSININDTMDYRYFYMSNKYYYDELARMSLIMSNAVSNGNSGVDNNQETKDMTYINTAMASIGMNCNYENVIKDSLKVGLAIGHKEIEYADIKKNVVLIAVSNARDLEEYNSFADVGETGWSNSLNSNHHKPYEILANEVYNKVKSYLQTNNVTENVVYWITGYGTGGGIANILSAKMIDKPLVSTNIEVEKNKKLWIFTLGTEIVSMPTGMTNVYSYTFGAPNVVYTLDGDTGVNNNKYKSIFNVVDNNDVTSHLLSTLTGWHKYGWNMSLTEKAEKCKDIISSYNSLMYLKTRDDMYIKRKNRFDKEDSMTLKEVLSYIQAARAYNDLNGDRTYFEGLSAVKNGTYKTFVNKYYANYKELEPKHSIKNYFELSKKLLPENMKMGDGWTERDKSEMLGGGVKDTLNILGEWYVQNVYTYRAGNYGAMRDESDKLVYYDADGDGKNEAIQYCEGDEYKTAFLERWNMHYNNAGSGSKDKRVKKLKEVNVGENDILNANDIDKYWSDYGQYEPCKRSKGTDRAYYKYKNANNDTTDSLEGKKVYDDCSAFASAVIYKFIKDNQVKDYENYSYNIWSSSDFMGDDVDNVLKDYGFVCYDKKSIKEENIDLQSGDLLCTNGHVEFYKGENNSNSFGWGKTHSSYSANPGMTFNKSTDGSYFKVGKTEYTKLYRFEG